MVVQSINKDSVIVEIEMSVSNFIRADETVNCYGDEKGIERGKLKRSSFCTKSKKEQMEKTNINKQSAIVIDLFLCEPKNDVDFLSSFHLSFPSFWLGLSSFGHKLLPGRLQQLTTLLTLISRLSSSTSPLVHRPSAPLHLSPK